MKDLFAALMAPLGPFENPPCLAVALSGGGDSLALCLLADHWCRERGGAVTALIVDHALRPESAVEARKVAGWMAERQIASQILTWVGDKPQSGVQELARNARYTLLQEACRRHGLFHLLVAHTAEDQAETLAMRQARGSVGTGAMAPLVETPYLRLLRPLLRQRRADLRDFLIGLGQDWIDDPSNLNPKFERVRMRAALAQSGEVEALAQRAEDEREALLSSDEDLALLAARFVAFQPAGFVEIDEAALSHPAAPRLLARAVRTVGGGPYLPSRTRLEAWLASWWGQGSLARLRPTSLGGCLLRPIQGRLLVVREERALPAPIPLAQVTAAGEGGLHWDRRFLLRFPRGSDRGQALILRPLGREGAAEVRRRMRAAGQEPRKRAGVPPALVWPGLPALWSDQGLKAAAFLWQEGGGEALDWDYRAFPAFPLTGPTRLLC